MKTTGNCPRFSEKNVLEILFSIVIIFLFGICGCRSHVVSVQSQGAHTNKINTETQATVKSAEANTPRIEFETTEHDLGIVTPDSIHPCQFKFKNTGGGILKINVQSAGSLSVPYTKECPAGQSETIEINFHAFHDPGPTICSWCVYSNDPNMRIVTLRIKATIKRYIEAYPDNVPLLLNKENAGLESITLKSVDSKAFAITALEVKDVVISADFDAHQKAAEHVLRPRVDVEKLKQLYPASGDLKITIRVDHPDQKEVVVVYSMLSEYELSPSRLNLQHLEYGEAVQREVWITNNYNRSFEIDSVESRNGCIEVLRQIKQDYKVRLDLEILLLPQKQGQKPRRYLTDDLTIQIKGGPALILRCSGWIKAIDTN